MSSLPPTAVASEVLFWLCAVMLLYVYAGYPLLLAILGLAWRRAAVGVAAEPTVTLIIPAYNEEHVIVTKITNTLELDYPPEKLNTLVVSDGSTDRTVQLAEELADGRKVRVLNFVRQGKMKLLNDAIQCATGEIVVVSDATVMLNGEAVRRLVAHYSDASVAAVSGSYRVPSNALERLYWRYEAYLKRNESALGCVCSLHGPLYSFRKALYQASSPRVLNDDDVISLNLLRRGYCVLYEPDAVATDLDHTRSFRQRVRTMAGSLQACTEIKGLCASFRAIPLIFFVSHTVLRLCVPLLLVSMAWLSISLAASPVYLGLLVVQLGFYGAAVLGATSRWQSPVARLPYYFCMRHAPILLAAYHAVYGFRRVKWK